MSWRERIGLAATRVGITHPRHRAILASLSWILLFVLLGKLAGAAKEMAVAYRYGVGIEVDAYSMLFNVVMWPAGLAFAVLTAVVVPLSARLRHTLPQVLARFRSELLALFLLVALLVTVLAWAGLSLLLATGRTGMSAETVVIAQGMVPAFAVIAPLLMIASLLSAWVLAGGHHVNTLLEGVSPVVIAVGVVAFAGGAEVLVLCTVAGVALHVVALAIPLARRGELEAPRFTHRSPEWSAFWSGIGIMVGGQALFSSTTVIDQLFAAHLGEGAVAALGYANRILALLIGLGATAVSRATLPAFSQAHARGDTDAHGVATHWVGVMFLLGLLAMVLAWLLAPWMIALLFERGAFDAEDTAVVASILRHGLPQLPFFFAGLVLTSLVTSQGRYRTLFWSAVLGFVVKIAANLILVPWLGVGGIALAWAFAYAATCTYFWVVTRRTT